MLGSFKDIKNWPADLRPRSTCIEKTGNGPKVEGTDREMEKRKLVDLDCPTFHGGSQGLFMDSWQLPNEHNLVRDAMYDRY